MAFKKINEFHDFSTDSLVRKPGKVLPTILLLSALLLILVFAVFFTVKIVRSKLENSLTITALSEKWKEYDYESCYNISKQILEEKPFNNTALTYHGYSSFYLAVSQMDTSLAQGYLDEAINSIRLALYNGRKSLKPQLEYMLGKAYFYKNTITSYYYSDLAIKYLNMAREDNYQADDIAQYLGLSYANLNKPMESISAFTEALVVNESSSLLLSIAEQYYKINQNSVAKQYLYRIKKESSDDFLVLKSMNLLGTIYIDEKNYSEAKKEFDTILEKNPNSADAYYGLGVIYEKQGDLVKARAEWRKALKYQINHAPALAKIASYGK